jgi:hypothetical protein
MRRAMTDLSFSPTNPRFSATGSVGASHQRIAGRRDFVSGGNMKEIPLTQGKVALVDDEDYAFLNQWKWCFNSKNYATRIDLSEGRKTILMHRLINKTPQNMFTDHINGNGLDNRKCNLRSCTCSQNCMNRGMRINNLSGYKGVSWHIGHKKWGVQINNLGKNIHVGYFSNIIDAAKAYNKAANAFYGEFARINEGIETHE